jgi:type IV secretion system protein VirB8
MALRQHNDFESEVFFSLRRQRTAFGFVAILSLCVATGLSMAFVRLIPLKETRPYIISIDSATGQSSLLAHVEPVGITDLQALREAELVRYVIARETYDVSDNRERITDVNRISVGGAAESLQKIWSSTSTDYPPRVYGRDTTIEVKVGSVTLLDGETARVRFLRKLTQPNNKPVTRFFVATVGFDFIPRVERRLEDVWKNPLGFRVKSYRIDAETLNSSSEANP